MCHIAWNRRKTFLHRLAAVMLILAVVGVFGYCPAGLAAKFQQKRFPSAEAAVQAVVDAMKNHDEKALLDILGPDGKLLISSGDEVADRTGRERFVAAFEEKHRFRKEGARKMILEVGKNDWPLPVPIVHGKGGWRLDVRAGMNEILNRRIGRNELDAIQVCLAFVDAQHEYAEKDRDGDGILEYAEKFVSDPGKQDGLFWDAEEWQEMSPLGPFAAAAHKEGYTGREPGGNPAPYHGYFFKILKSQGKHAPGGEYDYVINGNMMAGFAIVAYPAVYGGSGIMTFMVNHDGYVYEKDLGKNTESIVKQMKRFDPDRTWRRLD